MTALEIKATADISDLKTKMAQAQVSVTDLGNTAARTSTTISSGLSGAMTAASASAGVMATATSTLKNQISSIVSPAALVATGVTFLTGVLISYAQKASEASAATKKTQEEIKNLNQYVIQVANNAAKEQSTVFTLVKALEEENVSREKKLGALKELQRINPEYFGQLTLENNLVNGLSEAYEKYVGSIQKSIQNKIDEKRLENVFIKINEEQEKLAFNQITVASNQQQINNLYKTGGAEYAKQIERQNQALTNTSKLSQLEAERDKILKRIADRGFEGIKSGTPKEIKVKPDKLEIEPKETILKNVYGKGLRVIETSSEIRERLTKQLNEENEKIGKDRRVKPIKLPVEVTTNKIAEAIKNAEEILKEKMMNFQDLFKGTLANIKTEMLSGLGEAIGNVLGGKLEVKGIFDSLFTSIGSQIQNLGKFLIKSGIEIKLAKDAFKKLLANPVASIAVGVGLVALGALIKSQVGNQVPGFAKGVQNFRGGMALVGERGPELVNLPTGSDVIPNHKIGNISQADNVIFAETIIKGQDLRVVLKRADATFNRNY